MTTLSFRSPIVPCILCGAALLLASQSEGVEIIDGAAAVLAAEECSVISDTIASTAQSISGDSAAEDTFRDLVLEMGAMFDEVRQATLAGEKASGRRHLELAATKFEEARAVGEAGGILLDPVLGEEFFRQVETLSNYFFAATP